MSRKTKKKHKGRAKPNKVRKALQKGILTLMEENPQKSFNYKQLAAAFDVTDAPTRQIVLLILADLTQKKILQETDRGKFRIAKSREVITGRIEITKRGAGYIVNDVMEDIMCPPGKTGLALNGDIVEVKLRRIQDSSKPKGVVTKVAERVKTNFVGTFESHKDFGFVVPDDKYLHVHFFIPPKSFNGANHGEKVIVKLIDWLNKTDSPIAEVTKVLGKAGEHNTEMHAILAAYDLPYEFPSEVEEAAEAIDIRIPEEEIVKRRDMREDLTFTIDPFDAKDFDDALSLTLLENGNYEIGVHIADVSHYVRPGDIIDQEAYHRATSVYLVDRVVPMLPEKLSNGVCSLRPNEDKLCYSVIFEMTKDAKVVQHQINKTVIYSDRRFTYEEAQERIEKKEGDLQEELNTLDRLAKVLRKQRLSKGALEIESEEVKFQLDEKGKPTGVFHKVSKDANKLIEEFMLLANKYVAMEVGKPKRGTQPKPFVYRVHEPPDPDKLTRLVYFLNHVGYSIANLTPENCTVKLNELFRNMKDKQEINSIKTMAIRTMSKAIYDTDNIGHYGLAFDFYSHFTSPIRRYPDLIIHRLLFQYMNGKGKYGLDLNDACKYTSMRERIAAEAERESIRYKQVEYLSDKIGLAFDGVISGVADFGLFVELKDNKCEGMMRLSDIADDHYYFDEKAYVVRGKKYHREFFIGDEVRVVVTKTDLLKKEVSLELVDDKFE